MNARIMSLKAKAKNLAKTKGVPPQTTLQCYALERFLVRLSQSRYRDVFVLKGGLLISSWVGIAVRTTMDVDGSIHGMAITDETVTEFVKNVASIPVDDGFVLELRELEHLQIREDEVGIRVSMFAKADPLAIPFTVDLTSGDTLRPKEKLYAYPLIFGDGTIPVLSYSVENVLAEKLDSILSRSVLNTRMRDYYDLHTLCKVRPYSRETLKEAVASTFTQRGSEQMLENAERVIAEITSCESLHRLWEAYRHKFSYAANIEFDELIASVRKVVKYL